MCQDLFVIEHAHNLFKTRNVLLVQRNQFLALDRTGGELRLSSSLLLTRLIRFCLNLPTANVYQLSFWLLTSEPACYLFWTPLFNSPSRMIVPPLLALHTFAAAAQYNCLAYLCSLYACSLLDPIFVLHVQVLLSKRPLFSILAQRRGSVPFPPQYGVEQSSTMTYLLPDQDGNRDQLRDQISTRYFQGDQTEKKKLGRYKYSMTAIISLSCL